MWPIGGGAAAASAWWLAAGTDLVCASRGSAADEPCPGPCAKIGHARIRQADLAEANSTDDEKTSNGNWSRGLD